MALKPRYADAILDGTKTVELRRVRARLQPGQRVLVYASTPRKQLQGEFRVAKVTYGDPATLWPSLAPHAGVTFSEFMHYFEGAAICCAIEVAAATRWQRPVELAELRAAIEDFTPPQSYCFVSDRFVEDLGTLGPAR